MKEGERGPFFPKRRVRIKDSNSSPHGKFHRFLFPFSCKFPDLNFASYVLYIYLCGTHSEPGLPVVREQHGIEPCEIAKNFRVLRKCSNKFDCLIFEMFLLGCLWQTQSRSAFSLFVFFVFFFFFRVGKSLACHSPGKWCLCA